MQRQKKIARDHAARVLQRAATDLMLKRDKRKDDKLEVWVPGKLTVTLYCVCVCVRVCVCVCLCVCRTRRVHRMSFLVSGNHLFFGQSRQRKNVPTGLVIVHTR